jgi:hypothetical protein
MVVNGVGLEEPSPFRGTGRGGCHAGRVLKGASDRDRIHPRVRPMPYLTDTQYVGAASGCMGMSRAKRRERAQHRRASVVILPNGSPPGPVPPPARAGSIAARLLTHRSRSTLSQCAAVVLSSTPPRSFEMDNAGIWTMGSG